LLNQISIIPDPRPLKLTFHEIDRPQLLEIPKLGSIGGQIRCAARTQAQNQAKSTIQEYQAVRQKTVVLGIAPGKSLENVKCK
jgi:hypothetical protein